MRDNQSGFRRFLEQHIEKVALGAIAVVVGVMIYSGMQDDPAADKKPDRLKDMVNSVTNVMNDKNRWEVLSKKHPAPEDLDTRARTSREPVNANDYALGTTWSPTIIPPQQHQRRDPRLYPPTDLHVVAMTAALAVKTKEQDALAALPNAPKKSHDAPKDPKDKPKGSGSAGLGPQPADMAQNMPQPLGSSKGSTSKSPTKPKSGKKTERDESGPEFSGPGAPGYGFGGGMADARMLDAKYLLGTHKLNAGGGGAGFSQPGVVDDEENAPQEVTKAVGRNIVAISALIPVAKQIQEYEAALKNSPNYDPERDYPIWFTGQVTRVDVTDDPSKPVNAIVWPKTPTGQDQYHILLRESGAAVYIEKALKPIMAEWDGVAEDLADPTYVHPVFTMPVPPVLMAKLDTLSLHPKIPRISNKPKSEDGTTSNVETTEVLEDGITSPLGSSVPAAVGRPGSNTPSGSGATGNTPRPPSASGGGNSGLSSQETGRGVGPRAAGRGSSAVGPSGGMQAGQGDGSGRGNRSYGESEKPPEFWLIRVFDTTAVPGRVYRYRIRLVLTDPNHPDVVEKQPSERTLDKDALARIKDVDRRDEEAWTKAKERDPKAKLRRTFYRFTDWSEPTELVRIPSSPDQVLAGSVNLQKGERDPSSGKVVALHWDESFATWVPAEHTAHRGTALDFVEDAEVVHPLTTVIKKVEKYKFKLNSVVVDLRGGEPLQHDKSAKDKDKDKDAGDLMGPGEFAIMGPDGKISVRNELDDIEDFRRHTYAYERDAEKAASGFPNVGGLGAGQDEFMAPPPPPAGAGKSPRPPRGAGGK